MPVILHPYAGISNGLVAWAPRRMDLFTLPDVSGMTPVPWAKLLAIHEGRHVAQKQFLRTGFWTGFHYPFGELAEMIIGMVPNSSLLEGDAVVAETALTKAGRGRSADFLTAPATSATGTSGATGPSRSTRRISTGWAT